MNDVDHDLLIALRAEVVGLRLTVEAHNIASVERDTRIETVAKEINGKVRLHDQELAAHNTVPHSGIDHAASARLIEQINEMWTAWSVGKWVGAAGILALLGQTAALLMIGLKGG